MRIFSSLLLFFLIATIAYAQAPASPHATVGSDDISGMYTFLQEGEFVQVNVEEATRITGFISRYGDSEGDRGAFLDHMFKEGALKGNHLTFKTRTVHGVSFEFDGTVDRGNARTSADEGFRVLHGKLTEYIEDANKKTVARTREVTLKSFPQDAVAEHPVKD